MKHQLLKAVLLILALSWVIHLSLPLTSDTILLNPLLTAPNFSATHSYYPRVPRQCEQSFETIQCYAKCEDIDSIAGLLKIETLEDKVIRDLRVVSIALLKDRDERHRAEAVSSLDARPGVGMPCENKCETDPLYWSCVEDCDLRDHTWNWDECLEYEEEIKSVPCKVGALGHSVCQRCIVRATRNRLNTSCVLSYLPNYNSLEHNLCARMSVCNGTDPLAHYKDKDINTVVDECSTINTDNMEAMKMCVNDKIMFVQRECCYSELMRNATGCRKDNQKCDALCMNILSPRLCREKCLILRSDTILKCISDECGFYHDITETICDHCDPSSSNNTANVNVSQSYLDYQRDMSCVQGCGDDQISCVRNCLPYDENNVAPEYLINNCHNKEYIWNFSMFALENRRKHYWPNYLAGVESDFLLEWMAFYRTPFECGDNWCSGDNETGTLTRLELSELCEMNPFRAIDILACSMVQQDHRLNSLKQEDVLWNPGWLGCLNDPELEITQLILYKMIFDYENEKICTRPYCKKPKPGGPDDDDPINHPNAFANMKCQIHYCQKPGRSEFCKPKKDEFINELTEYPTCRWKMDLAKWENPYQLWSTYFNELHPAEIKYKLEYPDATEILRKSMFEGKSNYYTFPYFLVVRSVCDSNYYTEESYKYLTSGRTPIIEQTFHAPTNRQPLRKVIKGVFQSALINLQRDLIEDQELVPENPAIMKIKENGQIREIGCPLHLCYPAFAVPLMFLHMPHVDILVLDQYDIASLTKRFYVSQFHERKNSGKGVLHNPSDSQEEQSSSITRGGVPAHPGHLFPKKRSTFATDTELNYHFHCFANEVTDKLSKEYKERKCPELEHTLDDFDTPYEFNTFAPLDPEDIFRSQYSHLTSPTQAIAGFYDPKYILIGDADMNQFDVADWSKLLVKLDRARAKSRLISCVQFGAFYNQGWEKPIYSQMDRTDVTYPVNHYRRRYAAKPYFTSNEAKAANKIADTAIFEAISLEDRLLLVTDRGLISFYGHSNDTVVKDIAWTYRENETLNKCFKIVRVLPTAQPNSDLIVGVTYDYVIKNINQKKDTNNNPKDDDDIKYKPYVEVKQEIWVGKFSRAGEDIEWMEIKNRPQESLYLDEPVAEFVHPEAKYVAFKPDKDPGLPQEIREANPKSQIESICYKAYRSVINKNKNKVRLIDEENWCVALDATPVQLREDSIQVLVRMRTYFFKQNTQIYFYVVATHQINRLSSDVTWTIDSVIPRYPCVDEHREAVSNVFVYDERYFQTQRRGSETLDGCHVAHEDRLDFHIFLHGMTYPRAFTNHLFLYGSRLLQSTNNGRSFMILKGFPERFHDYLVPHLSGAIPNPSVPGGGAGSDLKRNRPVHRIVKMAFDDGGHYAFITNKLELWLGSTGSLKQIRLRPSKLQSMVHLGVSKVRNVHNGVPFSLDFDSNNGLYEMVAVVGKRGHVTQIVKRPVKEWLLMRGKKMLEEFELKSEELYDMRKNPGPLRPGQTVGLSEDLQKPFNYDIGKWTAFCSYASPSLRQNFSVPHSRSQGAFFPHPEQHLVWGRTHGEPSLLAFQASTFTLVWDTFFSTPERLYADQNMDPFLSWITNKKYAAFATMKTTLFSQEYPPEEHTILIQPKKYKRIVIAKLHASLLRNYYIDYNVTAEMIMEFSVRHDHSILNTDFAEDQLNSVELNVENSNGSIIQINTEKEVRAQKAAVVFVVRMSVKRKSGLVQSRPGTRFHPVPVTYHLVGAFGNCREDKKLGRVGDKIETVAVVGCPVNRELVFDWNATLRSIKLRGDRIEPNSMIHGIGSYCYESEYVCFFARSPVTFHFEIFDETKARHYPFHGKYIMRIIGGGRTRDSIKHYTPEEIDAFNIVGVSDASLIWNEWDPVHHKKVDRKSQRFYNADGDEILLKDSRENILTSGQSVISFVCHTLSPCARIAPTNTFEVVYWFRIFISNRDVDSDTLCLYEKEFDVMMYGFPPSPEFQLLATLGFCFVFLGIIYLGYLCRRQNAKLWHSTKLGAKNWYFIVKDAFPKKLRYHELPLSDETGEPHKHRKFRGFDTAEHGSREESMASLEDSDEGSSNPIASSSSTLNSLADSSSILPYHKRHLATTAKEIMYDQILTRRLNSIVDRNRTLRENLIKKATVYNLKDEWEQEHNFLKQFGRTVSQESVFTPPMPKDRNRGIDSFL